MSNMDKKTVEQEAPSFRVSRRNFLKAAGAGTAVAGATTFGSIPYSKSRAAAQGEWDQEADVVVVGSGAAALTAAVMAAESGASVVVLEKAETLGGTTIKSGGGYWIPNNSIMREHGLEDPREDALKYMVKYSYPQYYNPDAEGYGAFPNDFALIEAMYDRGSEAIDRLSELNALQSQELVMWDGELPLDYMEHYEENKSPNGRVIFPAPPEGSTGGGGPELIRQLSEAAEARGVTLLTGQRVDHVVQNENGEIVGVEVNSVTEGSDEAPEATPAESTGAPSSVRAKKAVIFGSGGFTHNPWMVLHYQRGPMHGGCAVITNEGDFVRIGGGIGAKMANMTGAFHAQIVFEQAMSYASVPDDVFFLPGDSSLMINRFGKRVTNEKRNYNDRTQIHFNWDPVRGEWTNQLLFYVYDQRTADRWAGSYPIPASGIEVPYLISGETLEELGQNINERLSQYRDRTGGVELDDTFDENFAQTIETFNAYAEAGEDAEFQRGNFPYDLQWGMSPPSGEDFQDEEWPDPNQPNITMHPLASEGPYYAVIIAGGTLTTNGGPVTNADMQVLNAEDQVIPGLYGAGTAIAAPSASAYWGGGATLGQAITTGYIAGLSAAEEPEKEV